MSEATGLLEGALADMRALAVHTQADVVAALEAADGGRAEQKLLERRTRDGRTRGEFDVRIIQDGAVFEQASFVVASVRGTLDTHTDQLARDGDRLQGEAPFRAEGFSMVFHSKHPFVPSTRIHYHYFERGDYWWFGGGADLTPYYLDEEGTAAFHRLHRQVCDRYDTAWYPQMKAASDKYFFIPHRGELRGVGGTFFDNFRGAGTEADRERLFAFVTESCAIIRDAYFPLVERGKAQPYGQAQVDWMEFRKGRYVEFDLMYDRGITFGLKTGMPADMCLMALPRRVQYNSFRPEPERGSPEARLQAVLRQPRDWT